jgi:hypothetical protein
MKKPARRGGLTGFSGAGTWRSDSAPQLNPGEEANLDQGLCGHARSAASLIVFAPLNMLDPVLTPVEIWLVNC